MTDEKNAAIQMAIQDGFDQAMAKTRSKPTKKQGISIPKEILDSVDRVAAERKKNTAALATGIGESEPTNKPRSKASVTEMSQIMRAAMGNMPFPAAPAGVTKPIIQQIADYNLAMQNAETYAQRLKIIEQEARKQAAGNPTQQDKFINERIDAGMVDVETIDREILAAAKTQREYDAKAAQTSQFSGDPGAVIEYNPLNGLPITPYEPSSRGVGRCQKCTGLFILNDAGRCSLCGYYQAKKGTSVAPPRQPPPLVRSRKVYAIKRKTS